MARRSSLASRIFPFVFGLLVGAGVLYFFLPGPSSGRGGGQPTQQAGQSRTAPAASTGPTGSTLAQIRARGYLQCGVSQGLPGFSNPDDKGVWTGIDVDFCKAIAAAVFGDPEKVKYRPLNAKDRFTALQSGEVDVLSRNTTWTMSRDTSLGFNFAGVIYYDGQGFIVKKSSGITSAAQLNGATICTQTGTTTELNLADYFRGQKMSYKVLPFEKNEEALSAYDNGRCDAYTTDASGLHAQRLILKTPDEHLVLPEVISKEPLGPLVRQGDPQWEDIVRWTLFALIDAEELGVTAANIDQQMTSPSPEVRRLLGTEGKFGEPLGLSNAWAADALRAVGNYGEMFERNVGTKTPLGIPRGLNALWRNGGVMYAPPIR
ncbi:amino acid ABC transporter substrate-binding protein [Parvibaculum sp.]|uniref:amino acid ABC transporter substrate-binding protein n=1 Tax=Parvibaculum sp. TaxID=2024848 RepID=UPI002C724987|nr:amino acid ABC transporter substrate-binding protein [Parvibaculum sp.]HUD52540.1 amino acid ABC transporter substrate-binding protein [Parvibaculum sp.]